MPLLTTYRAYPQLSLCSVLLLILGFLGAGLYLHNTYRNQQVQIQHYGQSLAHSAARQAVDATLSQDLISLQAVLQDVRRYPNVIGASVLNVENKMLVQSGYRADQAIAGERYDFSAPITLHNNIAGYVKITLEVPAHSQYDRYFLLIWVIAVALALLSIWWSIQRQWWSRLRERMPSPAKLVTDVVDKLPTIPDAPLEKAVEPAPPAVEVAVRLTIQISNLTRLYQQLNSEGFAKVVSQFEKQLHDVLKLYRGQRQLLDKDTLIIDFVGEAYYDCSFRALCSARLLTNLCARAKSPRLQISASIQEIARATEPGEPWLLKDFIVQQNDPQPASGDVKRGDILICRQLLDDTLLGHVEIETHTGKLLHIKAPYSELLAQQEERLATGS